MIKALENVEVGICISGQTVNNLQFADNIDPIAESPEVTFKC